MPTKSMSAIRSVPAPVLDQLSDGIQLGFQGVQSFTYATVNR